MELIDLTKVLKVGDKVYDIVYGIYFRLIRTNTLGTHPLIFEGGYCRTKYGQYVFNQDAESVIFPSQTQRDWQKYIDEKAEVQKRADLLTRAQKDYQIGCILYIDSMTIIGEPYFDKYPSMDILVQCRSGYERYIYKDGEWARIALKQEIFTTKDGVKIFTGDKYVTVSQRTLDLYIGKIGQENSGSSSDILWYFSTKEAAEKFVTAEKGRRLLTEAKLRYPIGTKFKIVSFPGYAEVKYDLKHYPITDQITDGAGGDVYCQGKWGEIISTPYTDCKSSPFTIEQENWIKNQINLNNRRDKCE